MFHVKHNNKYHYLLGLLVLLFCMQSCFRVHKARRIDINEIDDRNGIGLSAFVFEFDGDYVDFERKTKSFFGLNPNAFIPHSFTTTKLYPKDTLTVFINTSSDSDKWIRLVTLQQLLGSDESEPLPKKYPYYYISIAIKDQFDNDVLQEESIRNQTLMDKLNRYQRLID